MNVDVKSTGLLPFDVIPEATKTTPTVKLPEKLGTPKGLPCDPLQGGFTISTDNLTDTLLAGLL